MSEPPANTAPEGPSNPAAFDFKRTLPWLMLAVFGITTASLWLRLGNIQEQLAQQSAQATATSMEARALAKSASESAREAAAKHSLLEAKLAEVSLQRSQLEELIQSLSRSRDENLLEDIDSSLRLAQQQSALTGSLEPLAAALKSAEQRIARAAQPRLNAVQRAIAKDLTRLRASSSADIPGLLSKLDEAVRLVDELPMANGVPQRSAAKAVSAPKAAASQMASESSTAWRGHIGQWLSAWWQSLRSQSADLVRLSRIDAPEASLVAPEQAYMLRENLKLKLLNARLGLLARQTDASRADLRLSLQHVDKYFETTGKKTQALQAILNQTLALLANTDMPRPDDSLAALKLAGAAR
jgi:uroporphyrin-III C-methyltransferase